MALYPVCPSLAWALSSLPTSSCLCFLLLQYARQIIKGPDSRRSEWPEFAVKVLHRPRLQALGRDCLQLACRELAALHALSHPGVARLVSAFRYTDGYYLVLEYASRG